MLEPVQMVTFEPKAHESLGTKVGLAPVAVPVGAGTVPLYETDCGCGAALTIIAKKKDPSTAGRLSRSILPEGSFASARLMISTELTHLNSDLLRYVCE